MHIRQPERAAVKSISQLLVIEAEQVKNRRVQIVHVDLVLHGEVAELIRRPEREARLHARARQPDGEAAGIVVATGAVLLRVGRAAELAAPPDESKPSKTLITVMMSFLRRSILETARLATFSELFATSIAKRKSSMTLSFKPSF